MISFTLGTSIVLLASTSINTCCVLPYHYHIIFMLNVDFFFFFVSPIDIDISISMYRSISNTCLIVIVDGTNSALTLCVVCVVLCFV